MSAWRIEDCLVSSADISGPRSYNSKQICSRDLVSNRNQNCEYATFLIKGTDHSVEARAHSTKKNLQPFHNDAS